MPIVVQDSLLPGSKGGKLVDAKHISYTDLGQQLDDSDTSLFAVVKRLNDTVNSTPILNYSSSDTSNYCMDDSVDLGDTISLPIYVSTRAQGYCTFKIYKVTKPSSITTINSLDTIEYLKEHDTELSWEVVPEIRTNPGSQILNVGKATALGDFIYKVTVLDNNNRSCLFERAAAQAGEEKYTCEAIYYRRSCGNLQFSTNFIESAARTIYSYDTNGQYIHPTDTSQNKNKLEFPYSITSPLSGCLWLQYSLSYFASSSETISNGRPDKSENWHHVKISDVSAGSTISSSDSPVYLENLYFTSDGTQNGTPTNGIYKLYVEAVLTSSNSVAPDPDSNAVSNIQRSSGKVFSLDVLPENTVALSLTKSFNDIFTASTNSNSFISIPLISKTNITNFTSDNKLLVAGILYKFNTDTSSWEAERFTILRATHGKQISWILNTLEAGKYKIDIYSFLNNTIISNLESSLDNLLEHIAALTYGYGHITETNIEITQAAGEGAFYVGESSSDSFKNSLLFCFESTAGQYSTILDDKCGNYKLKFLKPISWTSEKIDPTKDDSEEIGLLELKHDNFAYLTDQSGNKISPWDLLYATENGSFKYNGFTLETYIKSECIGELDAHSISIAKPKSNNNQENDAIQGAYISYDKAFIGDGVEEITYPLLENTWQHIVLTVDRQINETISGQEKEIYNDGDINPIATLRVYLNGCLVQTKAMSTSAFTDSDNCTCLPLMLNAACHSDPDSSNSGINLEDGTGLTNRGKCKISMLRCYTTPLRPSQVYNNYINCIPESLKNETVAKNNSTLPLVYFIRNNVDESSLKAKWYRDKQLDNTTFAFLHTIKQKEADASAGLKGSKTSLVNCTMYYRYATQDGENISYTWVKEPDVDVFLQGTSSLEYPVKNYQIKVYDNNYTTAADGKVSRSKKYILPPGQSEATGWYTSDYRYTLKCDYMEHSHRNNTPTACFFQDEVLDNVIAAQHQSSEDPVSKFYSPPRQVIKESASTGSSYMPYRDAIDGFACGVYYSDTSTDVTWNDSTQKAEANGAETFAGSYMFNVDKEGAQLGFSIDGRDDLKCVSYEGGTNNNSSAAAFIPQSYSYFEYVKSTFKIFPTNYVEVTINTNPTENNFYRYDYSIVGLNEDDDANDMLLFNNDFRELNATLATSLSMYGGKFTTLDSYVNILSNAEFDESNIKSSYVSYSDYLVNFFISQNPIFKKFRKSDESYDYIKDTNSIIGRYVVDATTNKGRFIDEGSFGYNAANGDYKIYVLSGNGQQTAALDNIDDQSTFESSFESENAYIKATLDPRYAYDDNKDTSYAPIKAAINWVYEAADDKDKFTSEFRDYFSFEYCLTYYLQMMLFAQVDNAGKNAMFDIWGDPTLNENTLGIGNTNYVSQRGEAETIYGLGRLFPRPYDMDTQMGLDNSGKDIKPASVELNIDLSPSSIGGSDVGVNGVLGVSHSAVSSWLQSTRALPTGTRYNTYNTSESKLWKSFGKHFLTKIKETYAYLRDTGVYDVDYICSYVDNMTYSKIGEKTYNLDAALKYLSYKDAGKYDTRYYSCIQGNRRNRYKKFLEERIIFLDSLFEYSNKGAYTTLEIRSNAIRHKSVLGIQVYSPQYIKVSVDSGKQASIITYVDPNYTYEYQGRTFNGILLTLPTTGSDKNIVITGAGNIQALRHLEYFYLNKCNISAAVKLAEINLAGSTALSELDLGANKYLRSLNLRGTSSLKREISVKNCSNLESVDISNSGVRGLQLPPGTVLTSLNCSHSGINSLKLNDLSSLSRENLNIEGCTNLTTFEATNCPKLHSIDLSVFENLTSVKIHDCDLFSTVILQNLKGLSSIDLSGEGIREINIYNTSGRALAPLNLSACPNLIKINAGSTKTDLATNTGGIIVSSEVVLSELNMNLSMLGAITTETTITPGSYNFSNIRFSDDATLNINNNTGMINLIGLNFTGNLKHLCLNNTNLQALSGCILNSTKGSMESIFSGCTNLESIGTVADVENWTLDDVTVASSLFYRASKIKIEEGVTSPESDPIWKLISKLTAAVSFSNAFCISGFTGKLPGTLFANNCNIKNLTQAFYDTKITEVGAGLLTNCGGTLENARLIFGSCKYLVKVPYNLFYPCTSLTNLSEAFYGCRELGSTECSDCIMQSSETYFNPDNRIANIFGIFFGCTKLRISTDALSSFFSQLPRITQAQYCFFKCGSELDSSIHGPNLSPALFSNNKLLKFLDGAFANSKLSGNLPVSIFCNCNECKGISTSDTHIPNINDVLGIVSARGLFANCTGLTGNISKSFFKNTPALRLIGAVKGFNKSNPDVTLLLSSSNKSPKDWAPANTYLWNNTAVTLPGMFANTGIESFHPEFLSPLSELLDISMLFADVTCSTSEYIWNESGIEPTYSVNEPTKNLTCYDGKSISKIIPAKLLEKQNYLVDCSYLFAGRKGFQSLDANLFNKSNSSIKNLSGAFLNCTDLMNLNVDSTKNALEVLLSGKPNLVSLNSIFANDYQLQTIINGDIFKGNINLKDCSAMFLHNKKLNADNCEIPATLFNDCRDNLTDTSFMFAGCNNLIASIGTGSAIINDPNAVRKAYIDFLTDILKDSNLIEGTENLLNTKHSIDSIVSSNVLNLTYLKDRKNALEADFIELFEAEINKLWGDLDSADKLTFLHQKELFISDLLYGDSKLYVQNHEAYSDADDYIVYDASNEKYYADFDEYQNYSQTKYYEDFYTENLRFFGNKFDSKTTFAETATEIDELFKLYPSLQTFQEYSSKQRQISIIQSGLLGDCLKLTSVQHMFSQCHKLFGPIPADLFYNGKKKQVTANITSLAGLFDSCFNLTLDRPYLSTQDTKDLKFDSTTGKIALADIIYDSTTKGCVSRSGGGCHELVYPVVQYDSSNKVNAQDSCNYFIPTDWLMYLPNITDISRMFCSVGAMRNLEDTNYSIVKDEIKQNSQKPYYPLLILPSLVFADQANITTAAWAFAYSGTLGATVLSNDLLVGSLSTLTDISNMFRGTKIKGFIAQNDQELSIFEQNGKNLALNNVQYAFFGANNCPYFTVAAGLTSFYDSESMCCVRLVGYAPRFYSSNYFAKLSAENAKSVFGNTLATPYYTSGNVADTTNIHATYTENDNWGSSDLLDDSTWKISDTALSWSSLFKIYLSDNYS